MSGPEHLPPDDRELEDFLAGRGPHRARYHAASQEQAPAALDATVLSQAQAAVAGTSTVSAPPRRISRWRLPLSLAATLVLGVGLTARVLRETPVLPTAAIPTRDDAAAVTETYAVAPAAGQPVAAAPAAPPAAAVLADSAVPENARLAENRAQLSAADERMDRELVELARAEQKVQQAMARSAPQEIAPSPPSPPPPPKPAPAFEPSAPVLSESAASASGMAKSDSAAPAAPPVAAMATPAPRMETQAKRRAAVSSFAAEPVVTWTGRYRAESGTELELFDDGRFSLIGTSGQPARLSGHRRREAERERLLPDAETSLPCALWLQAPPASGLPESVQLSSDCESGYTGVYQREAAEP